MPYRYLNSNEAAQYLNLTDSDVEHLVKDREMPFELRGGRTVFRRQDLDTWASRRILSAEPEDLAEYHRKSSERASPLSGLLLPELIQPGRIDPAMRAKTKPSVLREMAALAASTGWVCDPAELTESLEAREADGSTAVPGGLALLHPRARQPYRFEESFLVLGRTVQPIHFGAPDFQPTDLFFLLCCADDKLHLHALARLCLLAQETDVLPQIRALEDAAAICECLVQAEEQVVSKRSQELAGRG
jgi:excisionase family DNA binding protein